jgi:hypothetical protein
MAALAALLIAHGAAMAATVVAITSPANGATVSGMVTIKCSVSSKVAWINVSIDGHYWASSPPYTFSWNTTSVANGSHSISVNAFNSRKSLLGSTSATVNVANATPTPTPTPTSPVTITSPTSNQTVSGTVSIAATVSSSAAWINVYVDGNYFASSPPDTFSWDSTGAANGSHTISAKAFSSSATLLGTASVTVNVQNQVATPTPTPTPSVVTITSPASNQTVSGTVSIDATVGSSVGWINVYIDGNYMSSSPPYAFSWDSTTVSDGNHTISATAYSSTDTMMGTASIIVNVQNSTTASSPTSTPTPTPTPTPDPASITPGATISSITGSPAGLSGSPDTNPADYGNYPVVGDGIGLIGGPLLDDQTAASFVKVTQLSTVETGAKDGATVASDNATENNYFNYDAATNPSDYLNQLSSFYSQWSSGAWGGAAARIDGACPIANPTTAEAAQWAANKWGINPLLLYAEAVQEGDWNQDSLGDNGTSSGVWQVADRNYPTHAFPGFQGASQNLARENTCFNADFYAAHLWAAFHGFTGECPAGDIGTAIQTWYQGTASAPGTYTASVYNHLTNEDWITLYFNGVAAPY